MKTIEISVVTSAISRFKDSLSSSSSLQKVLRKMTQVPSKIDIPYSLKNIPIIPKFQYQKMLISRIEQVLTRMRWKLFWSKAEEKQKVTTNFHGFKTINYPKPIPELKKFEEEVIAMVADLEMKHFTNPLQEEMRRDMNKIREVKEVIVPADKTANLYRIPTNQYTNFLTQNIQKEYKKVAAKEVKKINTEAANIAKDLKIEERVEAIALKPSFLTLKDHKEEFPGKLSFRLINPAKSNIGKVSKHVLDRINEDIRAATMANQWRSTKEVLDWFTSMERKQQKRWIKFDVEAFYPSISKSLLNKAIIFAKTFTIITKEEEEIIHHCRRSVLVGPKNTLWQKVSNPQFDVTMGSNDGAEICELVGLFMLNILAKVMPKENFGLYRDDGLCVVEGGGPEVERLRKKIVKLFKDHNLKITTESNSNVVQFLDVVMDLTSATFKPFTKPNAIIRYVSSMSNHPPCILKNLPDGINQRLSSISSGEEEYKMEVDQYQHALKEAGYEEKLVYKNQDKEQEEVVGRKTRRRKVIWFNPPWSSNVKTNIAGRFISLLKKHFPPKSDLYHLFNDKKVKVSYSTCPNMQAFITAHNSKLVKGEEDMQDPGCNCRGGRRMCPLQGRCQTPSLVYKAKVDTDTEHKEYIGQTAITFKLRFNNHKTSFTHSRKRHHTALSKYIWKQKDKGVDTTITWEPVSITNPYSIGGRNCSLCLTEKASIARGDPVIMLNKRAEIMSKCRHRLPHMLSNYITTPTPRPPPSPVQQHQLPEQADDQDPQLLPQHLQVCDQAPHHVQDNDPSLPPHPQLAGQADDEGGGGEAVHQGGGGAVGVADHHREDEHHGEPRRRGLRPKKTVRYKL